LAIEVTRLTPDITLRVLGTDRAGAAPESQVLTALRALLPRQSGLPQLFALLTAALARAPQQTSPGGDSLRQAIERLFSALLRSSQLGAGAGALRRALLDSGLLFDTRSASGRAATSDLKGLLLALLRQGTTPDDSPGAE